MFPTHDPRLTTHSARRGGAVIIVVLAMLSALAFLGFFFYSWSDQEAKNATNFSESGGQSANVNADASLDFALQQIIVSTPSQYQQSALHGGTVNGAPVSDKSLLAHIIGLVQANGTPVDVTLRDGRGITDVTIDNNGDGFPEATTSAQVLLDYDGDGIEDANGDGGGGLGLPAFRINNSAAANDIAAMPFANPFERVGTFFEFVRPDAGYTYPDLNSLFLAYESRIVEDQNGNGTVDPGEDLDGDGDVDGVPIVIPSFQRPQLFVDKRQANDFTGLYTDAVTAAQVLRPHLEHRYSDGTRRYIFGGGTNAQSGDRNRFIGPFSPNASFGTGSNQMGIFSSPGAPYELDADADGDGVLDSIWLDLDHPLINLADGRQAVPLFYVKIVDADALLNVNFHGNDALLTAASNAGVADVHDMVYELDPALARWAHASNLGLSPAEVNPLAALYADPTSTSFIAAGDVAAATVPHKGYVADRSGASPVDRTADSMGVDGLDRRGIANLELARLLHGSPEFNADLTYAAPVGTGDIPGRYGEVGAIRAALQGSGFGFGIFPLAGDTLTDDDGDDNDDPVALPPSAGNNGGTAPADNLAGGIAHIDDFYGQLAPPLAIPPSVHPLDFTGLGNYPLIGMSYVDTINGGVRGITPAGSTLRRGPDAFNPSGWLYYGTIPAAGTPKPALWQDQDNGIGVPIYGVSPWTMAQSAGYLQLQMPILFGSTVYDGLTNEPDELVADANFPTSVDAPFPPSELAGLHLSDLQWKLVGEDSRLRKLLPFNFQANRQASAIRRQFTTDSRDRLEHGHSVPWGEDKNLNGILDPGEDNDVDGALDGRTWEFNDDVTDALRPRFPPMFAGGITSRHELVDTLGAGAIDANDPFRPVTRRLLSSELNSANNFSGNRLLPGQRLNINRLLVNFDRNGNPIYRHLIPHAEFDGTETDTGSGTLPYLVAPGVPPTVRPLSHANAVPLQSYYIDGQSLDLLDPNILGDGTTFADVPLSAIDTDKFAREVWARHDRQRLARDIFTLLYTLGSPDELPGAPPTPFDPTAAAYPLTGSNDANSNGIADEVDRMAQFAVNYVDALDADDVITRFEYDGNLSDGWGDPPAPPGVVHGVETQQLTFSEVLLVQTNREGSDLNSTLHVDSDAEHRFLYVELRNATPFSVPLRTGTYRLARYADGIATTPDAWTRFRSNGATITDSKSVGPGENFLIACHDGTVTNAGGAAISSDFYADVENSTELEIVIPASGVSVPSNSSNPISDATPPPADPTQPPFVDLDFNVTDNMQPGHEQYYENVVPGTSLVDPDPTGTAAPISFQLRLERRQNLYGADQGEADWIEVDRIDVTGKPFLPGGDSQLDNVTALASVTSTERRQPFDFTTADFAAVSGTPIRQHSMDSRLPTKHTGNSAWAAISGSDPTTQFTLWQPHFNRDFSSVYELLSVPVVGPEFLIRRMRDAANGRLSGWADSDFMISTTVAWDRHFAAANVFRHPDGDLNNDGSYVETLANRWYRLLEFVEYPPRVHDTIRDLQSLRRRTEARINLNTVRNEAVLAGLIDDDIHLNTLAARPANDLKGPPAGPGTFRNWYDELLLARDGRDLFSSLPLPGVPGAMPFRAMSYVDPQGKLAATDPEPLLQNTLLRTHVPTGGALDNLPLFEARSSADVTGGIPDLVDFHTRNRILAKIANNSTNRSHVFVMWLGYELFEADEPTPGNPRIGARIEDLPGHREFVVVDMTRLEEAYIDDDPTDFNPGRFDFRKFIIYRKRVQ